MKRVLFIRPIHPSGMKMLEEKYDVVVADNEGPDYLKSIIGDFEAIVTRLTVMDRDLIAAGKKLQVIAKHGVGVDNIDVEAANEKNITIVTTGDANSIAVAEHTFFAIGALSKRIAYLDKAMRKGRWESRDEADSIEVTGKRIGIVGFGRIGQKVAKIAKQGFDMSVSVFDPFCDHHSVESMGYEYMNSLDEMCLTADIISIHVPFNDMTRNLFDEKRIALMKPNGLLINFARGGIVDEDALYRALKENKLAGAALDVFKSEPPDFSNKLFELDNVLLSPHCGTFTEESRERMSMRIAEGIDKVLNNGLA